jgi:hypothetical protein
LLRLWGTRSLDGGYVLQTSGSGTYTIYDDNPSISPPSTYYVPASGGGHMYTDTVYIHLLKSFFCNFKASVERQFIALKLPIHSLAYCTYTKPCCTAVSNTSLWRRPAAAGFAQRQSWHAEACHHVPVARFVDPWPSPAKRVSPLAPTNQGTVWMPKFLAKHYCSIFVVIW